MESNELQELFKKVKIIQEERLVSLVDKYYPEAKSKRTKRYTIKALQKANQHLEQCFWELYDRFNEAAKIIDDYSDLIDKQFNLIEELDKQLDELKEEQTKIKKE